MGELSGSDPFLGGQIRTDRVLEVVGGQWGVIGAGQLHRCGVGSKAVAARHTETQVADHAKAVAQDVKRLLARG